MESIRESGINLVVCLISRYTLRAWSRLFDLDIVGTISQRHPPIRYFPFVYVYAWEAHWPHHLDYYPVGGKSNTLSFSNSHNK